MADANYNVHVKTTADTSGAQQAAGALENVQRSTGSAARATDKLAQSDRLATVQKRDKTLAANEAAKRLAQLGEATDKGAAAGRVFGDIARGNVLALGQLGAALKALGTAAKANVFGVVLIAATGLLQLLSALNERLGLWKTKMEATGKAAENSAQQVNQFVTAASRFEQLKDDLAEVRSQFEAITSSANSLRDQLDALDDAKLALALAQIDRQEVEDLARPGVSEDEQRRIKAEAEVARSGAQQAAAERRASGQAQRARVNLANNQQQQFDNIGEQAELAIAEGGVRSKLQRFVDERDRLQSAIDSAGSTVGLEGVPETKDDVARMEMVERVRKELESIDKEIAQGRAALQKIQTEREAARKRGAELGRQEPALVKAVEAVEVNEQAARERNAAAQQAARNVRQQANKAAVDASDGGSGSGYFPFLGIQMPGVPASRPVPPPPAKDANALAREATAPSKNYEETARAIMQPEKDYDALAAAMLGLSDALMTKRKEEKSRLDGVIEQVKTMEQELRNEVATVRSQVANSGRNN